MSIEYIGERIFLQEVEAAGYVWVARCLHKSIYSLTLGGSGCSLPIWSSRERVAEFLKNARLVGPKFEPYAVPLDVFVTAWLSDKSMAISEVLVNSDGKSTRMLVLSAEEFSAAQPAKQR